jgi:hypothetical protein
MAFTSEQLGNALLLRFSGLCDEEPLPHELQMVILEAVHNKKKLDVLHLLKKAVEWKRDGELNEAYDICRQAVELDPTILFSRQLLAKLEKMKSDPDSVKEAERLRAELKERASRVQTVPTPAAKSGCPLRILLFVCVLSLPFVAAMALRSTPPRGGNSNSPVLGTR